MSTSTPIAPPGRAADVSAGGGEDPSTREIVVGVDGTECGLGAVRWAAQEAARRGAQLRIVHAAPYLSRRGPTGAPPPALSRARGITAVAYTVARHTEPGVQSSTEVVPGDPTAALLAAAASGQLVVLGSSATGAADEMVFVSVAVRVAAHSPAPVVVVPRRRGGDPAGRPTVAVLGVGEPADDEAVALFAVAAAQRSGTALSVLQTRPPRRSVADTWVADPTEWEQRFPGLDVRHTPLPAARADQVLRASIPSPLLVINAGHGTLLHRSLDGPHRWLLRHCTSPIALIPPADRPERDRRTETAAPG